MAAARDVFEEVGDSSVAHAKFLRKQIERIKKAKWICAWPGRSQTRVRLALNNYAWKLSV
jgi:hypothetical protein